VIRAFVGRLLHGTCFDQGKAKKVQMHSTRDRVSLDSVNKTGNYFYSTIPIIFENTCEHFSSISQLFHRHDSDDSESGIPGLLDCALQWIRT
jgi:hypothetical protein